jgi:hypothetical protein
LLQKALGQSTAASMACRLLGGCLSAAHVEKLMWGMKCPADAIKLAGLPRLSSGRTHPIVLAGEAYWGKCDYSQRAFDVGKTMAASGDHSFALLAWARANECGWSGYVRDSVRRLTFPEGVVHIGEQACSDCMLLEEVKLPSTLTTIGDNAFQECTMLREVQLPFTLTLIGRGAFWRCIRLTAVEIPPRITRIWESTFQRCIRLTEVKMPSSLTHTSQGHGCRLS